MVHGISGGGVSMQRPPQESVNGHGMVGVQVEPVGQLDVGPMVQGDKGVNEVWQTPPQVTIRLQEEPAPHYPLSGRC
ncbi:hypothetical protein PHISP_05135 [Aspergillus sp. HF37]|nr:hypothetical protein PHISP_05135 [Aspergillus sp. HF37]